MENSNRTLGYNLKKTSFCSSESTNSEVLALDECRKQLDKFNLSDEKILDIRNYLIGVVDKSINSYLDNFR